MKTEVVSISIHEAAEMIRAGLRAKGIDASQVLIESYGNTRVSITFDAKVDSKGRLLHRFELERALLHYTYHENNAP